MKRLLVVVMVAALGWSAWWAWSAWTLRSQTKAWFAAQQADGLEASYSDLRVRGFPNRVDLTLEGVVLADTGAGSGWEAPFVQLLGLSYKPNHKILVFPPRQVLTLDGDRYEITSQGLLASLVQDSDGALLRTNLQAEALNVQGPKHGVALAGVTAAMALAEARTYRIGLSAEALAAPDDALPQAAQRGEALRVQLEARFDSPWRLDSLGGPQPERLDLKLGEYRANGLELNLAGQLDVDAQGRGDGDMTLRAVNWQQMLAQARDSGQIPAALADTLDRGLSLIASLSGRRETLDLPLKFKRGEVYLGPIPLGKAPRLRLP